MKRKTCKPCMKLQSVLIADEMDLGSQRFCQQVSAACSSNTSASFCIKGVLSLLVSPGRSAASSIPLITSMAP